MEDNSGTSKVTFLWEIKDFPLYLTLHQEELESPPFFIKCSEVIGWFLVLRLRDDVLDCFLYRLNRMDDLGEIQVQCRISVAGENGTLHFTEEYTSRLINEARSLEIPDFLDTRLLGDEHLPDETLRLQCDLEIIARYDATTEWNSNVYLMEMSRNIHQLFETGRGSDWRLNVDGTEFRIHSFVIAARCPAFKDFDSEDCTMESPPQSPARTSNFRRLQEFVRLLELPPKSHVQERTAKSKAAKGRREERFLKLFNASVCDAFLSYLYSGRLDNIVMRDDLKLRLLIVARRYKLMDMVRKLQEVEDKCTAVTELVTDTATLDFDLGFLLERDFFYPITRLVNLSSKNKIYLQVTFSTVSDRLSGNSVHIYCQLIEIVLPVTLKAEIQVFNGELMDTPIVTYGCVETFFQRNEGWSLPLPVKIASYVRLKCTFTVCIHDTATMSQQEFSISPTYLTEPTSLRQLSYDLAAALLRSSRGGGDRCDLTIVVGGRALQAHRLVICAWSPILRASLEPVDRQLLPDVEFDALVSVVEYMYSGILFEKDPEKVRKVGEVARQFEMPDLLDICEQLLGE